MYMGRKRKEKGQEESKSADESQQELFEKEVKKEKGNE